MAQVSEEEEGPQEMEEELPTGLFSLPRARTKRGEEIMERPIPDRFIYFGTVEHKFRRREPEGFEATETLPSNIPTHVTRINPLMNMSSLMEAPSNSQEEDLPVSTSTSKVKVSRRLSDHVDSAPETLSPKNNDKVADLEHKMKLSSFSKDHYWFKSQTEREDSFMEATAETIYHERSEPDPCNGGAIQEEDNTSYS